MRRGTTPTYVFNLPFSTAMIDDIRVTFVQRKTSLAETRICKDLSECRLGENNVTVTLTQGETNQFIAGRDITVQVKVLTVDGSVLASKIRCIPCNGTLCEEVLFNGERNRI